MNETDIRLEQAAKIAAMDIFNHAIQREIESIPDERIALHLAQIKLLVNRQFYDLGRARDA